MRAIFFLLCIAMLFIETSCWWSRRRRRRSPPPPPPCSPIDCTVSSWSSWGSCNYQCGSGGIKSRLRSVLSSQSCGGQCPYSLYESKACNRGGCLNGGTPVSNGCICRSGYKGTCCGDGKFFKSWFMLVYRGSPQIGVLLNQEH